MVLNMKKKFEDVMGEFKEVNDGNLDRYISMAQECFPDWSNERKYCEHFFRLAKNNTDKDKLISNLLLEENGEYVSFGSVYGSRKIDLAYLHNDGTLVKFRRTGYHAKMVRKRCNLVFDMGIKDIYSILEEGSGSFFSYSKLGFQPSAKYSLYTK